MNKFWNMSVKDDIGTIDLYGEISDVTWWGDEVTPAQFKSDLANLGDIKNLDIHINSGGGDVFAGFTIYNMISRHKAHKTVYIDGLAASIASLIAMAGDEIIMPANSMMMIHNAWAAIAGNANDLREMADELEKVDGLLRDTYVSKTGLDAEIIADMMANETWFTANEAVEKGFATEIEEAVKMAASLDDKYFDRYKHVPDSLKTVTGTLASGETVFAVTGTYTPNTITLPAGYVTCTPYSITINADGTYTETKIVDLNNRGESEPVEEITPPADEQEIAEAPDTLEEQRKDFNRIRKKIYERE